VCFWIGHMSEGAGGNRAAHVPRIVVHGVDQHPRPPIRASLLAWVDREERCSVYDPPNSRMGDSDTIRGFSWAPGRKRPSDAGGAVGVQGRGRVPGAGVAFRATTFRPSLSSGLAWRGGEAQQRPATLCAVSA
jgi:hypothetical protein